MVIYNKISKFYSTGLFLSDKSSSLSRNPASVSTNDWPATVTTLCLSSLGFTTDLQNGQKHWVLNDSRAYN